MTAYIDGTTGETYYAKPLPLSSSPSWGDDVVSATENGSTGQFAFSNDATKAYWVFLQSGGSPASSDVATHVVDIERASQASVNTIDGIVDNILLDTDELQGNQSNWLTATGFSTFNPASDQVTVGTNNDKTGYALSSGQVTSLAAAIEAAIINELDGTAVMQAIADLIASDMTTGDLTVQAIASAVRDAVLNRVLAGNHDTAGSTGKVLQDILTDTAALDSRITGTIRTATEDATAETAQTTAIRNGLATSGNVSDAQDAITAILGTPAGASIAADIAAIEGGGGSTAWDELVTDHQSVGTFGYLFQQHPAPPNVANVKYVTRGDSYDGTANAVLSWPTSTDYTSGWTATLTVRHRATGASLLSKAITIASSTSITASLTAANTAFALLTSDDEFGPHPYDIQLDNGANQITLVPNGIMVIRKDRTSE